VIDPATEKVIGQVVDAGAKEAVAAIDAARGVVTNALPQDRTDA
jgi:acyl-CoA reductase-like NAD-dependent aldehyde dehydrogenase